MLLLGFVAFAFIEFIACDGRTSKDIPKTGLMDDDFAQDLIDGFTRSLQGRTVTEFIIELDKVEDIEEYDSLLCSLEPSLSSLVENMRINHPKTFYFIFEKQVYQSISDNQPFSLLDYNPKGFISEVNRTYPEGSFIKDYANRVVESSGIVPTLMSSTYLWLSYLTKEEYSEINFLFTVHVCITVENRCQGYNERK